MLKSMQKKKKNPIEKKRSHVIKALKYPQKRKETKK